MQRYLKTLILGTLCLSMISCSHIEKPDFKPGNKFQYGNGHYLNYRSIGSGNKKMILLHGFAASNRTWDDLLPLIKGFDGEVIMFDLIGHGFSSRGADDYSIEANAGIISDFIKSRGIKDYIIGGHSFGGGVALMTTLKQLDSNHRPEGLILIDSAAYKVDLPFFIYYLRLPFVGTTLLNLTPSEFQAKFTLKKLFYSDDMVTDKRIARYAFFLGMEGHSETMLKCAEQIVPENHEYYTSRYKNIDIPTLIIWGEDDSALDVESAYKLKKELPKSTLKILKECGHNPHEEYARETAEAIDGFIESLKQNGIK